MIERDTSAYFAELGDRIEKAFRAVEYDESRFPEIAREALEQNPAHASVDPVSLLYSVATESKLPPQLSGDSKFGEPPVTLFYGPRFVIDVYYWLDGSTGTHEHGFCGAFQVLGGSSLHAVRHFERHRRVNSRFMLGDVCTRRSEVLNVGDTRAILAGGAFAHALFHLEAPSTTVVVRTFTNPDAVPQYNYEPPHVAIDPTFSPRRRQLRMEALGALARIDRPRYLRALDDALTGATLEDVYVLMKTHALRCYAEHETLDHPEYLDRVALCEREHDKRDIEMLGRCFRHWCREEELMQGRLLTNERNERFLLASLMNAHSRSQLLDFMRSKSTDPIGAFMETFSSMARRRESDEETALGIELGEDAFELVRFLLEGVAPAELAARVEMSRGTTLDARARAKVEQFAKELLTIPVLSILAIP